MEQKLVSIELLFTFWEGEIREHLKEHLTEYLTQGWRIKEVVAVDGSGGPRDAVVGWVIVLLER